MTFAALSEAYGYDPPDVPDIPDDQCAWLLDAFWQLSERRPEGFSGIRRLGWQEIDAWARMMQVSLDRPAVHALIQLDNTLIEALNDVRHDQEEREG